MSAKRTAMRKIREVLRLSYSAGLSIRKINASTKISVGSIQNILKLAEQLNHLNDPPLSFGICPPIPGIDPLPKREKVGSS